KPATTFANSFHLKNQFQCQLDLPRRRCGADQARITWNNLPLRRPRCKRLATVRTVREVRMVEQIECLHPELRLQFFAQHIAVFEEREIEVVLDRSAESITAQVA